MRLLFVLCCLVGCGSAAAGRSTTPTASAEAAPPRVRTDSADLVRRQRVHASSFGSAFVSFMPRPVTSFGAAISGDRIFVLGGYDGTPHEYTPEGQSGELWSVDLETGRDWRAHPGVLGLQGLALVGDADRVCRIGGMRADASGDLYSVDEAECFSRDEQRWEPIASLPEPRSSHDAVLYEGVIYVVGGWNIQGDSQSARFASTMLEFDFAHPELGWRSHAVPFERRALGVEALDHKLYVVGGLQPDLVLSTRVDILDLSSDEWSPGPEVPAEAFGVAIEATSQKLYASALDGSVYELAEGAWTRRGSLAFPRFFHRILARNDNELIALGGIRGMTTAPRTTIIESFAIESTEPRITAIQLDYPGRARNRQGVFLHDQRLHLFGGNISLEQHDFEPRHFVAEHHVLDLPSLGWYEAAPYPAPRQTIQTAEIDEEHALAVGGFGHPQIGESGAPTEAVTHRQAFEYWFESDEWRSRPELPTARSQFGLAIHDQRLWLFGGLEYDPSRGGEAAFNHLTDIVSAPVDGGAFEVSGAMTSPRRAFGGAELNGKYYAVGGMAGGFALVSDCQVFDLEQRSWAEIACPRAPRLNPQLVALGGRLYLIGGSAMTEEGLVAERAIEAYDPETNAWSVWLDDIGIEPRHLRAFDFHDKLLLFSTHSAEPTIRLVLIELPRQPPTTQAGSPSAASSRESARGTSARTGNAGELTDSET